MEATDRAIGVYGQQRSKDPTLQTDWTTLGKDGGQPLPKHKFAFWPAFLIKLYVCRMIQSFSVTAKGA
jgi:hypothetical protein